jgi:hypothetical protein
MNAQTRTAPVSSNHPTVDLPAHLEGPRLQTTYTGRYCSVCSQNAAGAVDDGFGWVDLCTTHLDAEVTGGAVTPYVRRY